MQKHSSETQVEAVKEALAVATYNEAYQNNEIVIVLFKKHVLVTKNKFGLIGLFQIDQEKSLQELLVEKAVKKHIDASVNVGVLEYTTYLDSSLKDFDYSKALNGEVGEGVELKGEDLDSFSTEDVENAFAQIESLLEDSDGDKFNVLVLFECGFLGEDVQRVFTKEDLADYLYNPNSEVYYKLMDKAKENKAKTAKQEVEKELVKVGDILIDDNGMYYYIVGNLKGQYTLKPLGVTDENESEFTIKKTFLDFATIDEQELLPLVENLIIEVVEDEESKNEALLAEIFAMANRELWDLQVGDFVVFKNRGLNVKGYGYLQSEEEVNRALQYRYEISNIAFSQDVISLETIQSAFANLIDELDKQNKKLEKVDFQEERNK